MKYSVTAYVDALCETARKNRLTPPIIQRFLTIIRYNNDISKLPEILRRFQTRHRNTYGITNVEIISARDMKREIEPHLKDHFGKNAEINFTIKPEIIGGITICVNDEVLIDASVKRRLKDILRPAA